MNPFPNESAAYRTAREELLTAEVELRRQTERVASQRRTLTLGGIVAEDYEFDGFDGRVRLSEFFGDGKDTLYLYSFVFLPDAQGVPLARACPSCTSIIDGLDGAISHLSQRHVDYMWPIWAVLDLTPEGRGTGWGPSLQYD